MSVTASHAEAPSSQPALSPADLLPMVYEELRRLAAHKLAHEAPGQTLPHHATDGPIPAARRGDPKQCTCDLGAGSIPSPMEAL